MFFLYDYKNLYEVKLLFKLIFDSVLINEDELMKLIYDT